MCKNFFVEDGQSKVGGYSVLRVSREDVRFRDLRSLKAANCMLLQAESLKRQKPSGKSTVLKKHTEAVTDLSDHDEVYTSLTKEELAKLFTELQDGLLVCDLPRRNCRDFEPLYG